MTAGPGALSGPISTWPKWIRLPSGLVGMAVCAVLAVRYVAHSQSVFLEGDARFYAWPLFFVALPLLFDEVAKVRLGRWRALAALAFLGVQLSLLYVPYWWSIQVQLVVDGLLWGVGFGLLRYWFGEDYRPASRPVRRDGKPASAAAG